MVYKRDYHFEVETVESGQRAKYGDSFYSFVVKVISESDLDESVVQNFCTKFLHPAAPSRAKQKNPFHTYMTEFKKTGDRTYSYRCVSPSTH